MLNCANHACVPGPEAAPSNHSSAAADFCITADVFGGSMSDIVEQSTAYLSWDDLMAVAQYLLTPAENE